MHYLKDLQKIVEINSYTKNPQGVELVGEHFDIWLRELGFTVKLYKRETIGSHRYYTSKYNATAKRVLLLGHLDTVFPPGKFEYFSEDESWVYGPGVCDMKGGNIVFLEALRRLRQAEIEVCNVDILLVSDEETGSDDSKYLTMELAKSYDYCFVYEAAGENLELVSGRKGVGTFFIDIKGKAAHAGNHYTQGVDANLELSYKLQKLVELTDIKKGTTLNVGKIEGGIGANTISPQSHMTFELRYKEAQQRDQVLRSIEEIVHHSFVAGTEASLSGGIQRDVMQTTPESLQLLQKIQTLTQEEILYEERGGVSDANIVSSCGVVTLDGFGPYGDGDHTVNERALKSSFESRIALSQKLLAYFIQNGDFT
jgi:glutamate carboxypeptidase